MKKIRVFIYKFFVNRYGVTLEKQTASSFVVKGTNIVIPMYDNVKMLLRKHHRIHKHDKVEILIKPNASLKNILDLTGSAPTMYFVRMSTYKYRDRTWEVQFCNRYLEQLFYKVPEAISYEIIYLK